MAALIAGLILFFGVHCVAIVAPGWRDAMVRRIGAMPWKAVYSVIALIGLVLIVRGYGAARLDPAWLYYPPDWLRHVGMLLVLPVFPLLFATYLPGRIRSTLGHPLLVAVKLWALAHLLMNGTVADVLLFGAFLVWAVADRVAVKRRAARPAAAPALPATRGNDAVAVVVGLAVYVAFVFGLHAWLIGVPVVA